MTIDHRRSAANYRQREIDRLRNELEAAGFPRLKMMLIVALTGGCGFLASFVALHAGIERMAWRYPLAVGIAYLAFLLLLWLWLRSRADDYSDELSSPDGSGNAPGSGGDAGSDSSGVGDIVEAVGSADEFAIPLLLILAVASLVLATGWIIYSAPILFAELLVDGVLSTSLYRRLRGIDRRHWLETAIRRSIVPFLLTTVMTGAAGWIMQSMAPEARSVGGFLHHVRGT